MNIKNKMVLMSQVLSEVEDAEAAKTAASNNKNQAKKAKNAHIPAQMQEYTLVDDAQGRHSTICSTCTHICHQDCGLSEITTAGDNAFKGCAAFNGAENCRYCPRKCSFTAHFHGKKRIVKTSTTVDTVINDLLKKFKDAENSEGMYIKKKFNF